MLTDRGWAALGAALGLFLLWVALGDRELLAVGLLLFLAPALALLLVRASPPQVSVSRRLTPALVHEGDRTLVETVVTNKGRRAIRNPQVEDQVSGLGAARFRGGKLRPGNSAVASYHIVCRPRGIYRVGPAMLRIDDPLSLAEVGGPAGESDRLIVYPEVEVLVDFPIVRGRDPTLHAARPEFTHRGGEDFFTLREYRHGDDLRRVHWPTSAKRDELMIRQLETPWQSQALVFLDTRNTSFTSGEAFEKAVRGTASVVRHLYQSGFDADLWAGGVGVSSNTHDAYPRAMEVLAAVQTVPALEVRAVAARLQKEGRGGALILVTGVPDAELLAVQQVLSREYPSVILMSVSETSPAAVLQFQRTGAVTITIPPSGSWAAGWMQAVQRSWSTASAG